MSRDMSGAAPGKKTTDVHGVATLLRTLLAEGQDEQVIELVVGLLSLLVEKNTAAARAARAPVCARGAAVRSVRARQDALWRGDSNRGYPPP